ncbi:MAG: methyl-accepting chemotaxis protein [Melioribacteraceae bacterium]
MKKIKNLKFARKVQLSFAIVVSILGIVIISDLFQVNNMSEANKKIFVEYIDPVEHIDELYLEFQRAQFIMLQFSIPEFEDQFQSNLSEYNKHKSHIDGVLDSLTSHNFSIEISTKLLKVKEIWTDYKNLVADAIISAAASKTFDMAAVIATTSGQEVGVKLTAELDEISDSLLSNKKNIQTEFEQAVTNSIYWIYAGIFIGSLAFLFAGFSARTFVREVESFDELTVQLEKVIEANERGDLKEKLDSSGFEGGWKRVLDGLNKLRQSTLEPINEANEVLGLMADGDFTIKMGNNFKGDYKKLSCAINKVSASLSNIIGKVKESAEQLEISAAEISQKTIDMSDGANEQNAQTNEIVSSIEQMTSSITESSKRSTMAANTSIEAGEKAKLGGKVVEQTIEGINRIAEVVKESSQTIQELGKSSSEIGSITKVINEIADQTNLLALNAAIEAARAGEHGRGFAVVADEVRKLAERTTEATNQITSMIIKIQDDTTGAIKSIEVGTLEVNKGKDLASDTRGAIQEIINNTNDVAEMIEQLATTNEEQNVTSSQIAQSIETISGVTNESAENTNQIRFAAEGLHQLTDSLTDLVNQFKLDVPSNIQNYNESKSEISFEEDINQLQYEEQLT